MITVIPPITIPSSAQFRVIFFQKREKRMTGPNAAPKPAQEYETRPITELFETLAIR